MLSRVHMSIRPTMSVLLTPSVRLIILKRPICDRHATPANIIPVVRMSGNAAAAGRVAHLFRMRIRVGAIREQAGVVPMDDVVDVVLREQLLQEFRCQIVWHTCSAPQSLQYAPMP